jgi:hypothetical protein
MLVVADTIEPLRPYAEVVLAVLFVGFFLALLVVTVCNENRYVRGVYVSGFVTLLLTTNLILPVTPAPLVQWHKFSEVRPAEQTRYEVRVVDASGNELDYDDRTTWKVDGIAMGTVINELRSEATTASERREISQYLLGSARDHRENLGHRSLLFVLRFPPHGIGDTWAADEVEQYDEFVGIRLYRINVTTTDNGTKIAESSEEVVYEYMENETASERASIDTTVVDVARSYERPTAAGVTPV